MVALRTNSMHNIELRDRCAIDSYNNISKSTHAQ